MSEWTRKSNHGMHWGWYERRVTATDWCINIKNYDAVSNISRATRHLVKFGNEWGHRQFQHPRTAAHNNWHFWDNPEIPQLLWANPANPNGSKDWIRWVPGEILTSKHTQDGESRINDLLQHHSKGAVTDWQQIAPIVAQQHNNSKRVLLIPSSENNYVYYYEDTQQNWINRYTTMCEAMGYTVEVRYKRGRKQRVGSEVTHQLATGRYLCTVSQHSVAAIETIMAGYPAVVTGPHPCGDLATPWREFAQGNLRRPHRDDVEAWCRTLLGNCRHKSEIFGGTWNA